MVITGQNVSRAVRVCSIAVAMCLSVFGTASAGAETVRTDHFVPAEALSSNASFWCTRSSAAVADFEISYGQSKDSHGHGHLGELLQIRSRGELVSGKVMSQLTEVLASRTIEHVAVGCRQNGELEVYLRLWDGTVGSAEHEERQSSVTIHVDTAGKMLVR